MICRQNLLYFIDTYFFSYHVCKIASSVVDPEWFFFGSLNPYLYILNIDFSFVFKSFKCFRLHIMTRNKLFREVFLDKKEFICLKWTFFVEKLSNFISFLLQIHFGSGAIRILNDFLRILLKVSDPTWSGSESETTTLEIIRPYNFLFWNSSSRTSLTYVQSVVFEDKNDALIDCL